MAHDVYVSGLSRLRIEEIMRQELHSASKVWREKLSTLLHYMLVVLDHQLRQVRVSLGERDAHEAG